MVKISAADPTVQVQAGGIVQAVQQKLLINTLTGNLNVKGLAADPTIQASFVPLIEAASLASGPLWTAVNPPYAPVAPVGACLKLFTTVVKTVIGPLPLPLFPAHMCSIASVHFQASLWKRRRLLMRSSCVCVQTATAAAKVVAAACADDTTLAWAQKLIDAVQLSAATTGWSTQALATDPKVQVAMQSASQSLSHSHCILLCCIKARRP